MPCGKFDSTNQKHYPDLACDASSVWNFCPRFSDDNSPFAACHSRGTKLPYWTAKVALGQDRQKTYIILNGNFLCLSCPSATFALQYGSFVPRDWQAAKGLLHNFEWLFSFVCYVPVLLLLSSTTVLYHVIGKLQRAYLRGKQITVVFSVKKF